MELWNKYKAGDPKAKGELLISLKPLIRRYASRFKVSNIPFAVLEAKAFTIVDQALPKYDPSKAQMNTFVMNQLQQLNRTVADYADLGYIPEQRYLNIMAYNSKLSELRDSLNREPTTRELAHNLNWGDKEVARIRKELRGTFVEQTGLSSVYTEKNKDMDNIEYVYEVLAPQDQLVMEYLMGLHGREPKTLQEVSMLTGLTVDQIRHIKDKIKKKFEEAYSNINFNADLSKYAADSEYDERTYIKRLYGGSDEL
jgi:DNA-directed RNA polymerase sigma subunit (sigma70/sigma32)